MSDVTLSEEILDKLDKVGEQIQDTQSRVDRLKKNYDGLDVDAINRNSEEASKKYEDVQAEIRKITAEQEKAEKLQKGYEEMLERVKGIESELARGVGAPAQAAKFEAEYSKQITHYLRRGVILTDELANELCRMNVEKSTFGVTKAKFDLMHKDLLAGVGPEAGYFIMPERSATIVERIFESSPIRSVANVVTTGSNEWEQPLDDGEYESGWVEETQSRPVTDTSEIAMIRIPVAEMYARPRVTQKMLDDAGFDVEGWMNRRVSDRFGRKEANAFVIGDGAGKPRGFLDYDAWTTPGTYERHKIETRESVSSAQIEANDLIELQTDLIGVYQMAAVWGMKRKTFAEVMTLTDDYGRFLINTNLLREGADEVLLGKPVIMMDDMQAVAANAKAVVYADFSQFYTIVDRMGIRVLRDPYTEKPYISLYTTRRVGGAVTNYQAGKILKIKA